LFSKTNEKSLYNVYATNYTRIMSYDRFPEAQELRSGFPTPAGGELGAALGAFLACDPSKDNIVPVIP